jgi:hypothetical protein
MAKAKCNILPRTKFHGVTFCEDVPTAPRVLRRAIFQCPCGKRFETHVQSVKAGLTRSCGCLQDSTRRSPKKKTSDLSRKHVLYEAWWSMLRRCRDPKNKSFKNYGARGISVCDRWLKFENFLADMGTKPSSIHSIDRMDNDGNYEPSNCQWATPDQQARNRRPPKFLGRERDPDGFMATCEIAGISQWAVRSRLRRGWSIQEALNTPSRNDRSKKRA